MPFKRYMEVGRVVLINYGPNKGKVATVIDVVDQNKCLIDGCNTGVPRQVIPFTRISLTDLVVPCGRNARATQIKKMWEKAGTQAAWEATGVSKKLVARKKRAALTDFDRFKVMVAQKKRSHLIRVKMAQLSSEGKKEEAK
jgi:large subunit ribosomal protein L14e